MLEIDRNKWTLRITYPLQLVVEVDATGNSAAVTAEKDSSIGCCRCYCSRCSLSTAHVAIVRATE